MARSARFIGAVLLAYTAGALLSAQIGLSSVQLTTTQQVTLSASLLDGKGFPTDAPPSAITWTSSVPAVATATPAADKRSALIVAHTAGTTVVTVRVYAAISGTVLVTVTSGQPPARRMPQPSDFVYEGFYDLQPNGANTSYNQCMALRVVNGEPHVLTLSYLSTGRRLDEISLAGLAYGAKRTGKIRSWSAIGGIRDFTGCSWDEPNHRLITTSATDYTTTTNPTQIYTRTLNDDGTISNLIGPQSIPGVNAKRAYGGVQRVPAWFQQMFNVGPFSTGNGGYTSLVNAGGGAAIGPTLYTFPEPTSIPSGGSFPAGYNTLIDYGSASNNRGSRITLPINYFDGGDTRPNGTCPTCNQSMPTVPPAPGARFQSPTADGTGLMVWGDSYYNTAQWIDTPGGVSGYIAIASLCGGKCWYCASTLCSEKRQFELHGFDPMELGRARLGQVPVTVKPAWMRELVMPGMGGGGTGNSPSKNLAASAWDPTTGKLYIAGFWPASVSWMRVFVFQGPM